MPLKDLDKMTVVKLRAELIARGLDSRGNKPFLVERLRSAVELEEQNGCAGPEIKMLSGEDQGGNTSMEQEEEEEEDTPSLNTTENESESTMKVNNGSHHEKLESGTGVESEESAVAGDVSYLNSNSAPNDSISAVYGGRDETFMEDSSLDQSLDLSEKVTKKEDLVTEVDDEVDLSNGKVENSEDLVSDENKMISETTAAVETKEKSTYNPSQTTVAEMEPATSNNDTSVEQAEMEEAAVPNQQGTTPDENKDVAAVLNQERTTPDENKDVAAVLNQERTTPDENKDVAAVLNQEGTTPDENKDELQEKTDEQESDLSKTDEIKDSNKNENDRGNKRLRDRSTTPSAVHKPEGPPVEDEPEWDQNLVILDWYNSDLNLTIEKGNFLSATPLTDGGFAYMWAGARSTYGFINGKVCYEVKVVEHVSIPHLEGSEADPHVLRVGWSLDSTSLQLGEEPFSYGFGGKGKISEDSKFNDYGAAFQVNDVVGVYLDASEDKDKIELSYSINGTTHGVAFSIAKEELNNRALFPHILSKNCKFEVNFGDKEEPWFQPVEEFEWAAKIPLESRVRGAQAPASRADCKMIMMCGLPGAGKTTWANKFCSDNVEKKFNVLGTNAFLDKMKVNGLARRKNYNGRWEALIEKCTRCLNILLEIAAKRRRNYILDQTNVYPTAQKRKMSMFGGFQRKAVVIVPTEEEAKERTEKRIKEEGKDVPDTAVMEMKANFKIPSVDDTFSEVEFPELALEEALKVIEKYSTEAKAAGYGQPPSKRPRQQQQQQNYGNRNIKPNERDSRHPSGGRDSRSRDSRGSQSHRYSSSRSYRDSRDERPRPPPPSNWRGASSGPSRGGSGAMGRGGWSNRGPPPPMPSRSGPYSPRRGPQPPPVRGGWSAPPAERAYQGMRSSGSGGAGRSYDDRRQYDRPSYSTPRRDAPSPWANQGSSMSSSTPQRTQWSPSPQSWSGNNTSSGSSSSYGQQSSYGSASAYGGGSGSYGGSSGGGGGGGAGRPTNYASTGSTRPTGYSPAGSSRPSSYSSNGPARPTSYGGQSMPTRPSSYASAGGAAARPTNYGANGGSVNPWSQQQQTSYQQYPYNPQNHSAYSGGK